MGFNGLTYQHSLKKKETPVSDKTLKQIGQDKVESGLTKKMNVTSPPAIPIQRKKDKDDDENIQMKPSEEGGTLIQRQVDNMLPKDFQMKAEATFGEDFSNVKVHQNDATAKDMNALAYTRGENIHFASNQYNPNSLAGQELIGHELSHVVQQRQGRVENTHQAKGLPVNEDETLEQEADDMGKKITQAQTVASAKTGDRTVQLNNFTPYNSQPIQCRLPTFTNLESVYKDAALNIPEAVIKDMISRSLFRLEAEKKLKSSDAVPDIVNKIFPAPGVVVEAEFKKAVDVTDRNVIYQTVMDTNRPVKTGDRSKLKSMVEWAVKICRVAQTSTKSLERIFGTKTAEAEVIYEKAGDALEALIATDATIDSGISTDYNRDDPALNLGGWASFGRQHMHLQGDVVEVVSQKGTLITLIHEAAHLANNTVKDRGYYPGAKNQAAKDAFAGSTEDRKITNAAHFEEFPRRWLAKSVYSSNTVFVPGTKSGGGGALTLEDEVRDDVKEHYRKAWDIAVEVQWFLRDLRKEILGGNKARFTANLALVKEISQKMKLSIHHQKAGNETVTQVDLVLAEGVAKVANTMKKEAPNTALTAPLAVDADKPNAFDQIIKDTITANKTLLNDPVKDRVLIDWLAGHFPGFP